MAYIKVQEKFPGIRGLMAFRPETAAPLNALVDALLQSTEGITPGERELIATFVSTLNDCYYCQTTHGSVAAAHLNGDEELVLKVKSDYKNANISTKMKALLAIAEQVQKSGKNVKPESVEAARHAGASDLEIHDTVLISAAFCMYNRYVDGLGTQTHRDAELYRTRGAQIAKTGYVKANLELMKAQQST
jgi:uncharacterized peroxidase-related enzyme